MSSSGSSFINKTLKKKLPKAPPPRKPSGAPGAVSNTASTGVVPASSSASPQTSSNVPPPPARESPHRQPDVSDSVQLEQAVHEERAGIEETQHAVPDKSSKKKKGLPKAPPPRKPAGAPGSLQLERAARTVNAGAEQTHPSVGSPEASRKHARGEAPIGEDETHTRDLSNKKQRTVAPAGPEEQNESGGHPQQDRTSQAGKVTSTAGSEVASSAQTNQTDTAEDGTVGSEQQPGAANTAEEVLAANGSVPSKPVATAKDPNVSAVEGRAAPSPREGTPMVDAGSHERPVTDASNARPGQADAARGEKRRAEEDLPADVANKKRAIPRQRRQSAQTQQSDRSDSQFVSDHGQATESRPAKSRRGGRNPRPSSAQVNEADDVMPSNPWDELNTRQKRSRAASNTGKQRAADVADHAISDAPETEGPTASPRRTRRRSSQAQQDERETQPRPGEEAGTEHVAPTATSDQPVAKTSRKPRKPRNTKAPTQDNNNQQVSTFESEAATAADENETRAPTPGLPDHSEQQATEESIRHQIKTAKRARRKKSGESAAPTDNTAEDSATEAAVTAGEAESGPGEDNVQPSTSTSRRGRRRRSPTPPDAEDHRIDPASTAMWDLARDNRRGKLSNLERAMRKVDWKEVKRRREEEQSRALDSPNSGQEGNTQRMDDVGERLNRADEQAQEAAGGAAGDGAPAMKLVNGQIVFDTNNTGQANDAQAEAEAEAAAAEDAPNVDQFEESEITNSINTATWKNAHKRDKRERVTGRGGRWDEESTDKFYDAIGMFGADFTIIQKMFPDKTRRQVKLKFVREEKTNPERIRAVMVGPTSDKVPMSLATYAEMTGKQEDIFKDPAALNLELAAEREQQQRQLDQEREEQEENVKKKREKARERQKEKEKARREKVKKEKTKGVAENTANADGNDGDDAGGFQVDGADNADAEAGLDNYDEDFGIWGGEEDVTETIET